MPINDNIIQINKPSVNEICLSIAHKIRARRLELNLSQAGLTARSGVNIETYRRFERTGQVSLINLVMIAEALNLASEFASLFAQQQYQSLDELMNVQLKRKKRATRK
jgi:transcriptional regulator with XRE-family HTH domain